MLGFRGPHSGWKHLWLFWGQWDEPTADFAWHQSYITLIWCRKNSNYYCTSCFLHICDFLLLKHFLSDVLHGAKRRTTKEKSKQREFAHYECPCYKADGGGGQRGFLFGSLGEKWYNWNIIGIQKLYYTQVIKFSQFDFILIHQNSI